MNMEDYVVVSAEATSPAIAEVDTSSIRMASLADHMTVPTSSPVTSRDEAPVLPVLPPESIVPATLMNVLEQYVEDDEIAFENQMQVMVTALEMQTYHEFRERKRVTEEMRGKNLAAILGISDFNADELVVLKQYIEKSSESLSAGRDYEFFTLTFAYQVRNLL